MRQLAHSFLFCCPLRTGGLVISVVHMLSAVVLLFLDGDALVEFDSLFEEARQQGCYDGTAMEYNVVKILLLMDILIQALGFGFGISLLVGALKGKPHFVLAWVVFVLFAFLLYTSRVVGMYLSNWHSNLAHSHSTFALVSVVTLYCAAAMLKLQQELRDGQSARQVDTNSASAEGHVYPPHGTSPYAKATLDHHFERI